MKMAKPTERDIDTAGELLQVLDVIDKHHRWGGPQLADGPKDLFKALGDDEFDEDDPEHLQALYNHLAKLLRRSSNFHGRVIGGMCYVVCWDHNRILDPAQDVLDLHPDLRAGLVMLERHRADFLPRLEREARAAVASTIDAAAARHKLEMGLPPF
ncbi:hypothetical protein [Acidovorax sp. Root219]|uniref:hypothetical protein n=1 Tax=Acidovorax sp. Root219 TaxID=1736493 RepID=UPI00070F0107|nr:hypothetical protein [Acidovorax sp. Root219]KRC36275.1 hypothetical protein ASE28_01715 [Acidovorax sp. Root219]